MQISGSKRQFWEGLGSQESGADIWKLQIELKIHLLHPAGILRHHFHPVSNVPVSLHLSLLTFFLTPWELLFTPPLFLLLLLTFYGISNSPLKLKKYPHLTWPQLFCGTNEREEEGEEGWEAPTAPCRTPSRCRWPVHMCSWTDPPMIELDCKQSWSRGWKASIFTWFSFWAQKHSLSPPSTALHWFWTSPSWTDGPPLPSHTWRELLYFF